MKLIVAEMVKDHPSSDEVMVNEHFKAQNVYFFFALFILHLRDSDVSICFGR